MLNVSDIFKWKQISRLPQIKRRVLLTAHQVQILYDFLNIVADLITLEHDTPLDALIDLWLALLNYLFASVRFRCLFDTKRLRFESKF